MKERHGQTGSHPENIPPKEILTKTRAGLQASLLLDGLLPDTGTPIQRDELRHKLHTVRTELTAGRPLLVSTLTDSSRYERDEYWNGEESKYKDLSFAEQKSEWINKTNTFLARYDGKPEAAILEKLDIAVTDGAAALYEEYFGTGEEGHNGDIGYFAHKAATRLTEKELKDKDTLAFLEKLGCMYGKDSAEVARHLAEGIKNITESDFDTFADTAAQQFNQGKDMAGMEIIKKVHERNDAWKDKQEKQLQQNKPEQTTLDTTPPPDTAGTKTAIFPQPGPPVSDEAAKTPAGEKRGEDWHPLVVETGAHYESGSHDQDRHFVDQKSGSAGVFDGMGSCIYSGEDARTASDVISTQLAGIAPDLPLDRTQEAVRQTMERATHELKDARRERYHKMKADIEKNAAGELSDEDLAKIYEHAHFNTRWTVERIQKKLRENHETSLSDGQCNTIWKRVQGRTTAAVVHLWEGGVEEKKAIIAHVGDSRIYRMHEGKLESMTLDYNDLNDLLDPVEGKSIQDRKDTMENPTQKQLLGDRKITLQMSNPLHRAIYFGDGRLQTNYPLNDDMRREIEMIRQQSEQDDRDQVDTYVRIDKANLSIHKFTKKYDTGDGEVKVPLTAIDDYSTGSLESRNPSISTVDIESGDILLLTTDGIHDGPTRTELESIINAHKDDLDAAARALVAAGKSKNGDDATAVLMKIK